uniref:UDENN domain-containing protein n=1 Tax=Glossina pallidipes TaxID=7398 RepID=A0A1A9ZUW9_GLOPL
MNSIETGESVQSYSFVLTTDDSKWRFGFCRHDPKSLSTMVIITLLPWHDTFLRLLTVLAEVRRLNKSEFRQFLAEVYNSGVPDLGCQLKLIYNGGQSQFVFERPKQFQLPSIPENHNLNLYYNFVDPKNMIAVFAAMLAERRIIFTSRRLDRLSSCIQAANAFLYPMVWQHIFIPVLPMKLKDYLSAPMPYLIGVPQRVLETMMPEELGEVVILNCDTKIFDSPFHDVQDMPAEIVSQLKKYLSHSNQHMGDRVSKIFLGVLVQLIGGYRDAVEFRETGKTFNRDKFIESRPSHLRPFLTKMMDLQIFQQFIDERLEMMNTGLGFSDEFEQETVRYAEKLKKRGRFYQLKEKTNPAVKSAVKSVKESSRVAKHAYKDLKSKFRDITPPHPHNSQFRSHLSSNSQHDRLDGNHIKSILGPHSAPSSPVFNKRPGTGNKIAAHTGCIEYMPKDEIICANQYLRRGPTSLALSSSSSHVQANGHSLLITNNNPHRLSNQMTPSPAISPASSLCSSEMNLSQELQNHPLFKTPLVDRSLKPSHSLEPNHRITASRTGGQPPARPPPPAPHLLQQYQQQNQLPMAVANTPTYYNHPYSSNGGHKMLAGDSKKSLPAALNSQTTFLQRFQATPLQEDTGKCTAPPKQIPHHMQINAGELGNTASEEESIKDLISLDDSNNTSFDLEDFDPLNQNARPLPTAITTTATTTTTALNTSQALKNKSPALGPTSKNISTTVTSGNIIHNNHTCFTPQHHLTKSNVVQQRYLHQQQQQRQQQQQMPLLSDTPPPLPKSVPPPMPPPDDDFELLRKYGLDQFTLTTNYPSTTTNTINTITTATGTMNMVSSKKISLANTNSRNGCLTITNGMKNWTTFD